MLFITTHLVSLSCTFQAILAPLFSLEELGREIHECSHRKSCDLFRRNLERIICSSLKADNFPLDKCTLVAFATCISGHTEHWRSWDPESVSQSHSCVILRESLNPSSFSYFLCDMKMVKTILVQRSELALLSHYPLLLSFRPFEPKIFETVPWTQTYRSMIARV